LRERITTPPAAQINGRLGASTAALCSVHCPDTTIFDEVDTRSRRVVGWALVVLSVLLTMAAGSDFGPVALLFAAPIALIMGVNLLV